MLKKILSINKLFIKFVLMFIVSYILYLFIGFFINLNNFYEKKDIDNYPKFINFISKQIQLETLNDNAKIIFIIDKFDFHQPESWHGQMVLDTIKKNLDQCYPHYKSGKDFKIIPIQLSNNFNEGIISINKQKYVINNYLFIKNMKEKYPLKTLAINQSFVYSNIVSDLYLTKQFNDLSIIVSIAAGNFQSFENTSFKVFIKNYSMKFFSFLKQTIFFVFLKDYFNNKYIKFNLNKLSDNNHKLINKNIDINDIFNSSATSMKNNILFFAKKNPKFFLLSGNLSSSGATPLGLNSILFKN
jgi:hypothetical protein